MSLTPRSHSYSVLLKMIHVAPATLEGQRVRLEPLEMKHADGLRLAAADGDLWNLFFTYVPHPDSVGDYIEAALAGQADGHMCPWAVIDRASERVLGSTRFHDILPAVDRVRLATRGMVPVVTGPT